MTNAYISIDMEGIAGIAALRQVWRGSDDYPAARALMTEEANAAIAGAIEGGANSVVVNDSHGDMANLLAEQLDPRANLLIGTPKPWSMMQGFGSEFDVCLFVGYHAGVGTEAAVLDHTYSGRLIYEVRVNGEPWNEADLNAALAGTYGVPVGLVTGDDKCCAQAAARLKGVHFVAVKEGLGRGVAKTMHPTAARAAIREASRLAVAGVRDLEPFRPEPPFGLEADLANTSATELCALPPGVERIGPRTVRYESSDFRDVFRCLMAWTYLGASEAPRYAGT